MSLHRCSNCALIHTRAQLAAVISSGPASARRWYRNEGSERELPDFGGSMDARRRTKLITRDLKRVLGVRPSNVTDTPLEEGAIFPAHLIPTNLHTLAGTPLDVAEHIETSRITLVRHARRVPFCFSCALLLRQCGEVALPTLDSPSLSPPTAASFHL